MRKIWLPVAVALVVLIPSGCSDRPKDVLSEGDMVDLLADMELADAYVMGRSAFSEDSMRRLLHESVLERHGVTNAQMDSSLQWYGANLDVYVEMQDKVAARLRRQASRLLPDIGGADAGLWTLPRMMRVSPLSPDDGLIFSLAPSGLQPGDILELSGVILQPSSGVKSLLGVEYSDGTAGYATRDLSMGSERRFTAELQTDSLKEVRRIFGTIRATDDNFGRLLIDSLAMQRRPFDASLYQRIHSQRLYRLPHRRTEEELQSEIKTVPQGPPPSPHMGPPSVPQPMPVPPPSSSRGLRKRTGASAGPPSIPAPRRR